MGDTALAFLDFQKLILLEPVSQISIQPDLEKSDGPHIRRQFADDHRQLR